MVCCSNPGCDSVAYLHTSTENKRFIFSVPGFVCKNCFDISHDEKFIGMLSENNNLGSRQKRTTCRGHKIYNYICEQYETIINRNKHDSHTSKNDDNIKGMSDKEDNFFLQLSFKKQKINSSGDTSVLHQKGTSIIRKIYLIMHAKQIKFKQQLSKMNAANLHNCLLNLVMNTYCCENLNRNSFPVI